MNARFITPMVALLSLIASDAFAYTVLCSHEELLEKGPKARLRIELPPGGTDALSNAFRSYAAGHNLSFFDSRDHQMMRDGPRALALETRRSGVWWTTRINTMPDTVDITIRTTCYADEDWELPWREFEAFVAASNYRVLNVERIPSWRETQRAFAAQLIQNMSVPPLTPADTE